MQMLNSRWESQENWTFVLQDDSKSIGEVVEELELECVHKGATIFLDIRNDLHNPKQIFYLYNYVRLPSLWPPKLLILKHLMEPNFLIHSYKG